MFTFKKLNVSDESLANYSKVLSEAFLDSKKFNLKYLQWLYRDNPSGVALGFDAYVGATLVAHYACIPKFIRVNGETVKTLLSLNTATISQYQGKGLFSKLAALTYQLGFDEGFSSVHGVANSNSTPGFVRKLGFQLVCPLSVSLGYGHMNVNWSEVKDVAEFFPVWGKDELKWRIKNPENIVFVKEYRNSYSQLFARVSKFNVINAYAELPQTTTCIHHDSNTLSPIRLFIGLIPPAARGKSFYISVPDYLKPSPLNFIYKSLSNEGHTINASCTLFTFLDFDAY